MNLYSCILLLLASLWPQAGVSQSRSLNLEQSLELAFENSERLRIASLQMGQADDQIREVQSSALPQVSSSLSYSRFFDAPVIPTPIGDFPIKRDWDLSLEARVSQVIWAFGRVSNAIDAAKIFKNLSELGLEQARHEIASQVKSLYFSALMAEKTLMIVQESYDNAKRNQNSLRRRFARGRVPQFDNLKMETDIALRLPQVIEAEQELANIKAKLKFFLGLTQETDIQIVGEWPSRKATIQKSAMLSQVFDSNLELKLLDRQKALYQKQSQNERASRYPTIAAFAYYQKAGTGDRYYIGGDNLIDTTAVGVQINYDIWTGGSRSARLASSLKDERIAEENIGQMRRNIDGEIAAIDSNLQNLERNLVASRRAQTLAKEAYEITLARYEAGQASQIDLNDAELNQTRSRINIELILFSRQMEWIKLEKMLARI